MKAIAWIVIVIVVLGFFLLPRVPFEIQDTVRVEDNLKNYNKVNQYGMPIVACYVQPGEQFKVTKLVTLNGSTPAVELESTTRGVSCSGALPEREVTKVDD